MLRATLALPRHRPSLTPMESPRLSEMLLDLDLLVLVGPEVDPVFVEGLSLPTSASHIEWLSARPPKGDCSAVLVVLRDLADLRLVATGLRQVGAVRKVAVCFETEPDQLPAVVCRPEWPPLEAVVGSRAGGFLLWAFSEPVHARAVLLEVARRCGVGARLPLQWPALGVLRGQPHVWPIADPGATVADEKRLFDQSVDFPPDLILVEDGAPDMGRSVSEHPVLGRSPVVTRIERDLTWGELAALGTGAGRASLAARGPVSLGGVDTAIFNPVGFERGLTGAPLQTVAGGDGSLMLEGNGQAPVRIADPRGRIDEVGRRALRAVPALQVDWKGTLGPQQYCRFVMASAAAGVPLVPTHIPEWTGALLAPALLTALAQPVDTFDRLAREEHSVRLRRAALTYHGSAAWRRSLASASSQAPPPVPLTSIMLVTRRPQMLAFALRQIARQRGADFEVVLVTHGFEADEDVVGSFRSSTGVALTTLSAEPSEFFGSLLNRAARVASGDHLLKMDDDDWYGPDFVADLLLAQSYSGADIVGCGAEFTFLQQLWMTARRDGPSEAFQPFVAGGTLLVTRQSLVEVGGFRPTRKYVDAGLLAGMHSAGGTIYRTHGLGYLLRRASHGHTWDPGLGYFLTRNLAADQWRGFRPSALLCPASEDIPRRPANDTLGRRPHGKVEP